MIIKKFRLSFSKWGMATSGRVLGGSFGLANILLTYFSRLFFLIPADISGLQNGAVSVAYILYTE